MRVAINFDLRNPARWRRPTDRVYGEALEFIEEAEALGIDMVAVSEHHGWDDGYIGQGLTFLAAAAARTTRIRLMAGTMLLSLRNPADLAEQIAIVDAISGGRVELAMGTGYREVEFDLFGVNRNRRYRIYEENLLRMRELWASGRVQPTPIQDSIPMFGAFRGPRGSRLSGELGLGLYTAALESDTWGDYLEGWNSVPEQTGDPQLASTLMLMLADDPDAAVHVLRERIEDHCSAYDRHAAEGDPSIELAELSAEQRLELGGFWNHEVRERWKAVLGGDRFPFGCGLLTPEDATRGILERAAGLPVEHVKLWATVGGQFDEMAHRNLELIAKELRPRLQGA